jgi:hypothetical protein
VFWVNYWLALTISAGLSFSFARALRFCSRWRSMRRFLLEVESLVPAHASGSCLCPGQFRSALARWRQSLHRLGKVYSCLRKKSFSPTVELQGHATIDTGQENRLG